MTDCSEYIILISCLIDGEITSEEKAELFAHMEQCSECKAMYEDMLKMSEELAKLEAERSLKKKEKN